MKIVFLLVLVVIITLLNTQSIFAQNWNQEEFFSVRSSHSMAYIGDDKVLMFGGLIGLEEVQTGFGINRETWIYDLSDGSWTQDASGTSPSARYAHSMAYIGDDKVLMFGGIVGTERNGETWVYDLSDGSWTQDASGISPSARVGHSMAYIGDDKVLLFGGFPYDDGTWIYDLSDGSWTLDASGISPSIVSYHSMAYIGDDKVLMFNGYSWIYDLSDGSWTRDASGISPSESLFRSMAYIGDDKVLLFCGPKNYPGNGETWVYDLSKGSWMQDASGISPSARYQHSMAYIGDDKVLMFGGWTYSGRNGETWVYDLSGRSWKDESGISLTARYDHSMAYIGDDKVLLFGGLSSTERNGETWVYDLSDGIWMQDASGTSPSARYAHSMAYIGDDKVLLFGGYTNSGLNGETWVFDLSDGSWVQDASGTSPSARYQHSMAYIGDNKVLLLGGETNSGINGETWVYDLSDGSWTQDASGTSPSARYAHSMAFIGDNKVLLFGGWTGTYNGETWVYDLSNGNWTQDASGTSPSVKHEHSMAYIGDNKVLLFGGWTKSNLNGETWVYDLSDGSWMQDASGTNPFARYAHSMAYIGDDKVLMFGGWTKSGINGETWVYSLPLSTPTVSTEPITSITHISASSGGTVTDDGGEEITARGIVWSNITNPELTNNEEGHTKNGTGTGSFISSITGLDAGTTYYVRAYATNSVGTAYGDEFQFLTEGFITPDPPALISPFNWSWKVSVLPVLEWENIPIADSYTLQIARDGGFWNIIYENQNIPTSNFQVPADILEYYTGYYWRVAVNLRGETFEFSAHWRFNTEKLECVMISPEPWAIDVTRTPTFEWSEEPNVDSYHLEISTYSDFSSLLLDEPALTETTYDYPGVLNFGNNYYWRVVPKANGVEGYKREYSRFRTEDIGTPELIAPSDREADIPIRPSFSWGTVSNADAYILEVSDGYGYWTPVVHEIKFETEHSVTDLDLLYDENYFWRVRAVIGTEKGPWAPIRMFWIEKIGVPELYSPSDFSYNVALTPTLEWEDLFGAASYNLQMSQRSNFRTLEFEVADITGNTYEIPAGDLTYNTRYYWRVSQNKANQTGDWSDDFSFRTQRAKGLDLYTLESGNMLSPPFPNPFSSTTSFSLNLSDEQYVNIELNDMLGKKVATIYSGILPNGLHDFTINSHGLTDGVYLYRIQGTDFMETGKVVLKR